MIKALLFDLSRTLLFPVNKSYLGELNKLHAELSVRAGYNIWENFTLDQNLLNYLNEMKDKYEICLFTSGTIQNTPQLREYLDKVFKKIYSSSDIGLSKSDPKAYEFIAADLMCSPGEIGFFDDSEENVNAAKSAGIKALMYQDFNRFKADLTTILLAV